MPKIEMGKTYKTRDGRPVRILCVDRQDTEYTVVGLVADSEVGQWTAEGSYYYASLHPFKTDLIEVRPRITQDFWANVYRKGTETCFHRSKEEADKWRSPDRLACVQVRIDCEEGEGLS